MPKDTITFQLATQYLSKIALRLECLVFTIKEAALETHPVIHHYALKNIIEIIKLIEKPELKSRFLKELIRIDHALNKTTLDVKNPLYTNLFSQIQFLNHICGGFGEDIQHDSFLQSIRFSASDITDNDLQTPQLLLWLDNSHQKRQKDLKKWLNGLQSLSDTVSIYLSLLRHSVQFNKIKMLHGFHHHPLSTKDSCHLILIEMQKNNGIVPKIQLCHYGLSLRLCDASSMNEIQKTNTALDLGICQL